MSASKYRYNRICDYCKKSFEAQKVTTRYCGHSCNKAGYKLRQRLANIADAEADAKRTMANTQTPAVVLHQLREREFLSVVQAGRLLGCSRQAVYNLINSGRLRAVNLATRKTIIKRSEIDRLFA